MRPSLQLLGPRLERFWDPTTAPVCPHFHAQCQAPEMTAVRNSNFIEATGSPFEGIVPRSGRLPSNFGIIEPEDNKERTGTLWTATAHVITAVIGSGVLSLAWALAQLGWIAGPLTLLVFGVVTYWTSAMLADSYRTPHPVTGKRNPTYMDAVRAKLGPGNVKACGVLQNILLFGTCVGYTITTSHSLVAIERAGCYHTRGHEADCERSLSFYMLGFGVTQLVFSQIPNFHQMAWLSVLAAIMSVSYSSIGLGLGLAESIDSGVKGTLTGVSIGEGEGEVSMTMKLVSVATALGNIAFAYSFALILTTIQDTLKSPPAENKVMKKATGIGIAVTTSFYMSVGCFGYAAFGSDAPGDLLTDFGFYEPFWLVDLANVCLVVHLVGAYQVFAQPLFAFMEDTIFSGRSKRCGLLLSINKDYTLHVPGTSIKVNPFRLTYRSCFVGITTLLAVMLPFFNAIMGLLGAIGFWPLTIYFPIEMYKKQTSVHTGSLKWFTLQVVSLVSLAISLTAAASSAYSVYLKSQTTRPFS